MKKPAKKKCLWEQITDLGVFRLDVSAGIHNTEERRQAADLRDELTRLLGAK